ncbi:unnamed protein product, partial [Brassica rapa subsp. trilocularis]
TTVRCRRRRDAGESYSYRAYERRNIKGIIRERERERGCLTVTGTFRRRTIHGSLRRRSLTLRDLLPRRISPLTTPDSSRLSSASLGLCSEWFLFCFVVVVCIQYKICSWLALIFCAQSLANMRNLETDLKQISMAMMFAIMGLVTNYLGPNRPAATKK